jgi:glycosyltransferase involved in cell wall biosynthesis
MRIAFLYGRFSLGNRPLDFDNLYEAPRGLTGSELSCVEYAQAMRDRGHEVTLIVGQPMLPRQWEGVTVCQLDNPKAVDDHDAVLSWNEPNLFLETSDKPLRVVNQQLNDFAYCRPGWENVVDIVTSPSAHHLEFLRRPRTEHERAHGLEEWRDTTHNVKAWDVLPNGCDPAMYEERERIPGRVIWASSADRGLHRLLEVWPEIKRRVPEASLRAFYNYQPAHFDELEAPGPDVHPDLLEIAQSKRYIGYAMEKLGANDIGSAANLRWDVQHIGSVSREQMRREFEQSTVLGYPCMTIRYTEGFSVTTMEACASGCLPIITDIDSLGHIYGGAVPMVHLEPGEWMTRQKLAEFTDLVVRGLTDEAWRVENMAKCQALAAKHAWPVLAARLEDIIRDGLDRKRGGKKKSASKMIGKPLSERMAATGGE